MGVLTDSSRFRKVGVLAGCGLRSSDGYEAETGVFIVLCLAFRSIPEAAEVAAVVAAEGASVAVVDLSLIHI